MNFTSDIRVEMELARGGEAIISQGTLVGLFWREKYPAFAGDSKVAIKQFFEKNPAATEGRARVELKFQQEVAIIFALQGSSNVVKLLGFTQDPNTLIMPLYLGDLTNFIHDKIRHKYLFGDVVLIVKQLIYGLRAIHVANVAHRDFKPKNIILAPREEGRGKLMPSKKQSSSTFPFPYTMKITDFGVAYLNVSNAQQINNDHEIKVINKFGLSYPYAAPEMFQHLSDSMACGIRKLTNI